MKSLVLRYSLMVMATLLAINFALNPMLNKYGSRIVRAQLDQYHQDLLKGPYFLIMKYYESVPADRIPAKTRELQKEFGFPVNAVPLGTDELTPSERQALERGELLIRNDWTTYYRRVRQTDFAIKLGPFQDLDDGHRLWQLNVVIWGSLISLVVLISLVAALPFWRNLRAVMEAARRFGEGDFSARARVSKRSALHRMAEAFNGMADRIGSLIRSQKFLINAASHEFRTPIARIRFGMEMLETAKDPARRQRYASGIIEDIDDLESLVSELLAYTALDGKRAVLAREPVDTAAFLNDTVQKLVPLACGKHIDFHLSHQAGTLNADPKALARGIENLVLNGLRHAKTSVRIRAGNRGGGFEIRVTDDGPGIPKADLERIFEPFVRLDESRSRESGGYGLGLAIVRQIVAAHGGRVWAEAGQGGCFVVVLPQHLKQ